MHFLLTNDDGYFAPGIRLLKQVLKEQNSSYTVVAPQNQRSAFSSALTLFEPIFLYESPEGPQEYYISGTPVDCVKLAVNQLLTQKPALLLSGINLGANLGINVFYSGTVAAAFEGVFNDIPAIALSLHSDHPGDFEKIKPGLSKLLEQLIPLAQRPEKVVWNVNIPALPPEKIKGIRLTHLSKAFYKDYYERRTDLHGRSYFWLGGNIQMQATVEDPSADSVAVEEGYISVTPLTFERTALRSVEDSPKFSW